MKSLIDFKDDIHKCSKCGICQADCPVYQATGNDCSVLRGFFVMLGGVLRGDLKLSKTINRYLDLCLKCGACVKSCPSGINAVDVIISAKAEYFKTHPFERVKTFFQKYFIFGLIPRIVRTFIPSMESKKFDEKIIYFGGCGSKFKGDKTIVKILNSINVEVINPVFHCCGMPYLVRGDLNEFNNSMRSYISILKKYNIKEVVTSCASCEKSLKEYIKWTDENLSDFDIEFLKSINVINIYKYLRKKNISLKLQKSQKVTYHKPCHIENFDDVKWLIDNTENLEYVEMQGFDKCCGLNGIAKIREYETMLKIYNEKRNSIKKTNAKNVLTSCLGCESALNLYSLRKYKAYDLLDFIAKNL